MHELKLVRNIEADDALAAEIGTNLRGEPTLPGFRELNIQPKAVEEVMPTYIGRSRVPESD